MADWLSCRSSSRCLTQADTPGQTVHAVRRPAVSGSTRDQGAPRLSGRVPTQGRTERPEPDAAARTGARPQLRCRSPETSFNSQRDLRARSPAPARPGPWPPPPLPAAFSNLLLPHFPPPAAGHLDRSASSPPAPPLGQLPGLGLLALRSQSLLLSMTTLERRDDEKHSECTVTAPRVPGFQCCRPRVSSGWPVRVGVFSEGLGLEVPPAQVPCCQQ